MVDLTRIELLFSMFCRQSLYGYSTWTSEVRFTENKVYAPVEAARAVQTEKNLYMKGSLIIEFQISFVPLDIVRMSELLCMNK